MKSIQLTPNPFLYVLAFFMILFSACEKEETDISEEKTTKVRVRLNGSETQSPPVKSAIAGQSRLNHSQSELIQFSEDYLIMATLTPESEDNPEALSQHPTGDNKVIRSRAATPIRTPLDIGTAYTIAVYTPSGTYVKHQDLIYATNQVPEISIAPGDYIFLAVASGNNTLLKINYNQPLSNINLSVTDPDVDMMYFRQEMTVQPNIVNDLDIILKHLFTQVTLSVNTAEIGVVASYGQASISPNYSSVNLALSTGNVAYPGSSTAAAKTLTISNNSGQLLVSNPIFLFPNNTNAGSVTIAGLTIGPVTKALTFNNLTINDGIKYNLEFRLLAAGINLGYETWSGGNLIYDAASGRYGFTTSDNDYGNYWFYNHILPKRLDGTNQGPDPAINGNAGDPCALVAPAGIWRLPTEQEVDALLEHTGPNGVDNPHNVNTWDPARYVDTFDGGTSATNRGMFFGTQNNPGAQRHDYLFFVFAGAYHNENAPNPTIGAEGNYLLTGTSGGYREFHLTGGIGTVGYGASVGQADLNSAYQIRCVKN